MTLDSPVTPGGGYTASRRVSVADPAFQLGLLYIAHTPAVVDSAGGRDLHRCPNRLRLPGLFTSVRGSAVFVVPVRLSNPDACRPNRSRQSGPPLMMSPCLTSRRFSNSGTDGVGLACCRAILWWTSVFLRRTRHRARIHACDPSRTDRDARPPSRSVRAGLWPVRNFCAHAGSLAVRRYSPARAVGRQLGKSARLLGATCGHPSQRSNPAPSRQLRVRSDAARAGGRRVQRRKERSVRRQDQGVSRNVAGCAADGHQGTEDDGAVWRVVRGGASGRLRRRGRGCGASPR